MPSSASRGSISTVNGVVCVLATNGDARLYWPGGAASADE